jgi:hypothetical protein
VLFGLVGSLSACGSGTQTQSGLVSAPGPNRPWTSDDLGHDAISNGNESCAKSGKPEDDPLKHRVPPCPEGKDPAGKPHPGH